MIAAYGREVTSRLSKPDYLSRIPHTRYLISWQIPDDDPFEIPERLTKRDDVKIEIIRGKGVSRNRNNLLKMAQAPYLLCADCDISYEPTGIKEIIDTFESNPEVDIATFKIEIDEPRPYPKEARELKYRRWKRNFYPYVVETAMRLESVGRYGLTFNEHYGINAEELGAGEEDVFIFDAWKKGAIIKFFPKTILKHPGKSTIERLGATEAVLKARGAVLRHIYGRTSWVNRLKVAVTLPGNKLRNWRTIRQGMIYERTLNQ